MSNISSIEEEVKLAYSTVQIDKMMNGGDINKIAKELEKELKKNDEKALVVVIDNKLEITYKGYEVTIEQDGYIKIEDMSKEKPKLIVTPLPSSEEDPDSIQIQVTATTTEGEIEMIESIEGLQTIQDISSSEKIFEAIQNGTYYFRAKGTNGRTAKEKIEISSIVTKSESILQELSNITESGEQTITVRGFDNEGNKDIVHYSLNIINFSKEELENGKLVLNGEKEVKGATLVNKQYEFGNVNDVGNEETGANGYAKNTVVLKVDGDIEISQNVIVTSVKSENGYGGPKGMIIYCTGKIINNGTISMTERGAKAVGKNVYLWKNANETDKTKQYEYIPAVGGNGGGSVNGYTGPVGVTGANGSNGIKRGTGGGASGASTGGYISGRYPSGKGANGSSYSGGSGGGGGSGQKGNNDTRNRSN